MTQTLKTIKRATRFSVIFPFLIALNVALFIAGQAAKERPADWVNIKIPINKMD